MNGEDLNKYWRPAALNLYKLGVLPHGIVPELYYRLEDALNITELQEFAGRKISLDRPMNKKLCRIFVMLAGPHAVTVLKAYRIKKGLSDEL